MNTYNIKTAYNLHVIGSNVHRDTKYANPLGDVVDNSVGINLVDGTSENKPVRTERNGSRGYFLTMYSKPSWLYQ